MPQPVVCLTVRLEGSPVGGATPTFPHCFLAEEFPRVTPESKGGHVFLRLPLQLPLRQTGLQASFTPWLKSCVADQGPQEMDSEMEA